MRAPLRVLNDLAARFRDRTIAEIGTRNGDGMQCFSQVASTALAIEMQPSYCEKLRGRLAKLKARGARGYEVVCDKFEQVDPERFRGVELIHWWVGGNLNAMLLQTAMALHARGVLGANAEVVINFDQRWGNDIQNWRGLQPMARWSHKIDFDECDACTRRYPLHRQDRYLTCTRATGSVVVAGFRLGELNATAVAAATPLYEPPTHYKSPCFGANHSFRPRPAVYEGT